jgi:hypothetical protein
VAVLKDIVKLASETDKQIRQFYKPVAFVPAYFYRIIQNCFKPSGNRRVYAGN